MDSARVEVRDCARGREAVVICGVEGVVGVAGVAMAGEEVRIGGGGDRDVGEGMAVLLFGLIEGWILG